MKKFIILFFILLFASTYTDDIEIESFCEREGQTICQAFCSPVSFKKCKKNITSQNYDYCCVCEFFEGSLKNQCIPVIATEY